MSNTLLRATLRFFLAFPHTGGVRGTRRGRRRACATMPDWTQSVGPGHRLLLAGGCTCCDRCGSAATTLRGKLYQLELAKREEELAQFYGDRGSISWGNQIRSYVLQPYQMCKDLRTETETSDVDGVLDGDLDTFIEAYLTRRSEKQ